MLRLMIVVSAASENDSPNFDMTII